MPVKMIAALPRRADKSVDEFLQHWRTIHARHAGAIDRIRAYVQSARVAPTLLGVPTCRFDGFPEVWFADIDSALGLGEDPQYVNGAHQDEPNFIDVEAIARCWIQPVLVRHWPGYRHAGPPGKLLVLLRDAAPIPAEVLKSAVSRLEPLRIAVGVAVDDPRVAQRTDFTMALELWWEDHEAAVAGWSAGGAEFLTFLETRCSLSQSVVTLVHERLVRVNPGLDDPEMV